MITTPTVFVLGAGASQPFGFPLGQDLLNKVLTLPVSKSEAVDCLHALGHNEKEIDRFCTRLGGSAAPSVDAFLENRSEEFLEIGKRAIAAVLKQYEQHDRLFGLSSANHNWYGYLRNQIFAPPELFRQNKLSIVTYNYDRSLEHFLYTALRYTYNLLEEDCVSALHSITIIHLHGQLALLPWQDKEGQPYDSRIAPDSLKQAADSITIVHEAVPSSPQFEAARQLLRDAEHIVFLGFGYHPTNVSRLFPDMSVLGRKTVWGTGVGLTGAETNKVARQFGGAHFITDYDCIGLLRNIADKIV